MQGVIIVHQNRKSIVATCPSCKVHFGGICANVFWHSLTSSSVLWSLSFFQLCQECQVMSEWRTLGKSLQKFRKKWVKNETSFHFSINFWSGTYPKFLLYWNIVFNLLGTKDETGVRSSETSSFTNAHQFTLLRVKWEIMQLVWIVDFKKTKI